MASLKDGITKHSLRILDELEVESSLRHLQKKGTLDSEATTKIRKENSTRQARAQVLLDDFLISESKRASFVAVLWETGQEELAKLLDPKGVHDAARAAGAGTQPAQPYTGPLPKLKPHLFTFGDKLSIAPVLDHMNVAGVLNKYNYDRIKNDRFFETPLAQASALVDWIEIDGKRRIPPFIRALYATEQTSLIDILDPDGVFRPGQ